MAVVRSSRLRAATRAASPAGDTPSLLTAARDVWAGAALLEPGPDPSQCSRCQGRKNSSAGVVMEASAVYEHAPLAKRLRPVASCAVSARGGLAGFTLEHALLVVLAPPPPLRAACPPRLAQGRAGLTTGGLRLKALAISTHWGGTAIIIPEFAVANKIAGARLAPRSQISTGVILVPPRRLPFFWIPLLVFEAKSGGLISGLPDL